MLVDLLTAYLTRVVPDAKLTTYKEILPFLYQLDPQKYEVQFNQFTTFLDDYDTINNVAQFDDAIFKLLTEAIEDFGIYLSDTEDLTDRIPSIGKIAKGLYLIDQYEDLLAIKYLYDAAENSRECIADILHLVDNTISANEFLEMVEEVSPALIRRIRDLVSDLDYQFVVDSLEDNHEEVERVKNALGVLGVDRAVRYFQQGGRVGENLESYLDYYLSNTEKHPPATIAKLAVFSAIAAGIANSEIQSVLSELLPSYYPETTELLPITRAVLAISLPEAIDVKA